MGANIVQREKENPRLCLPPIFLHPVKNLESVKINGV